MGVPYDVFTGAFLSKVTEYEFSKMDAFDRQEIIDGYMKRALSEFRKNCKHDLFTTADDVAREFNVDIPIEDLDELADIVSEGMLVQWMKPYTYKQESLENALNTRDFTTYSVSELLKSVCAAYKQAQRDYTNAIREYSYNHGDLTELHL